MLYTPLEVKYVFPVHINVSNAIDCTQWEFNHSTVMLEKKIPSSNVSLQRRHKNIMVYPMVGI